MATRTSCPSCGEGFLLPEEFRTSLEGKRVECCCCRQAFEPYAGRGVIGRFLGGRSEIVPIDLTPYREEPSEIGGFDVGTGATSGEPGEPLTAKAVPAPARGARAPTPPGAVLPVDDPADETVPDRPVLRLASIRRLEVGPSIHLVGVEGKASGRTFKIDKSRTLIGRNSGDIQLGDGKASRVHAQLDVTENGQILLRDLASTNGTSVNGLAITVARLEAGNVIGVGDCRLRLVIKH